MLDPEVFGKAMGEAIRAAVEPLKRRIADLEARGPGKGLDGKDGTDGAPGQDGAQGPQGLQGERGADGAEGQPGRDGADGKSITLDDVAPVLELAIAKAALDFERRAQDTLQKAIDRIPAPKDGLNGKDGENGRDGVGFDDLQVEYDGVKTVTFKLQREGVTKEFDVVIPVVVDRGIYKDTESYTAGDGVTWAGSFWIAQKDTTAKPDSGDGWRLAVKKGRDGRDGRDGIDKTAPVKL